MAHTLLDEMTGWVARQVRDGVPVFETPGGMIYKGGLVDGLFGAAVDRLVREGSFGWHPVAGGWLELREVTAA